VLSHFCEKALKSFLIINASSLLFMVLSLTVNCLGNNELASDFVELSILFLFAFSFLYFLGIPFALQHWLFFKLMNPKITRPNWQVLQLWGLSFFSLYPTYFWSKVAYTNSLYLDETGPNDYLFPIYCTTWPLLISLISAIFLTHRQFKKQNLISSSSLPH